MFRSRLESRRRFVQGLAGGALVLAGGHKLGWGAAAASGSGGLARAASASWGVAGGASASRGTSGGGASGANNNREAVLSGTDFQLEVGSGPVNFTGVS